jgi:hypothetical protein
MDATATYSRRLDRARNDALRATGYRGPAYLHGRPAYDYSSEDGTDERTS